MINKTSKRTSNFSNRHALNRQNKFGANSVAKVRKRTIKKLIFGYCDKDPQKWR